MPDIIRKEKQIETANELNKSIKKISSPKA